MRDNFPLAVAATISILSFGIVVLFVTVGILEKNTSHEIQIQHIDNLFDNATEIAKDTRNSTKYELLQFFNKTSDVLRNNPELLRLQQQWESFDNSTRNNP
jgi:hypothetical protein